MKRPLWFSQLICEDDANSVVCPVRVIGLTGFISLLGGTAYLVATKGAFEPLQFASAVSVLAAAVGAGAGIKAKMGA